MSIDDERYWCGSPGPVDDCHRPIGDEFIDGKTIHGPWAIMNPVTWSKIGVGQLGTGFGQRYKLQTDNRWLKVEG